MDRKTRILIVEDDMIIAANLSLQLTRLGYEVTGIESRGEEAIIHANRNAPDIILMDIHLKGSLDGIETVKAIHEQEDIPVIYLTANADEATFSRARVTHPHAFIAKPFNIRDLERAVALVGEKRNKGPQVNPGRRTDLKVISDRVFIRHNGKMVKLLLDEILYVEADRNYCHIVTPKASHLVVSTLKVIEMELDPARFIRIHRSYVVNITELDVLADGHVEIGRKVIPLSKSCKELLLSRLHLI